MSRFVHRGVELAIDPKRKPYHASALVLVCWCALPERGDPWQERKGIDFSIESYKIRPFSNAKSFWIFGGLDRPKKEALSCLCICAGLLICFARKGGNPLQVKKSIDFSIESYKIEPLKMPIRFWRTKGIGGAPIDEPKRMERVLLTNQRKSENYYWRSDLAWLLLP